MANDWVAVPFGDLLIGGTRNGVYKRKEFHGSGVKIVNMGELFAHPRLRNVPMKRVELTPKELAKASLQPGDLLFARRSLVAEGAGKCSIVVDVTEPTTFESSIIRARPAPNRADALFLYYYFNSPKGKHLLGTILRQVAVSGITGSDLVRLRIPQPPLDLQRRIAAIPSALDDKGDLNRRMNRTLERMAAAIFKSWFIDFDPVRAKAEHRDTGLSREVASLFPDSFEDSELGEIPKGWRPGMLGDIADNPRRSVKPKDVPPTTPYIGLEHMPRRSIALDTWGRADQVGSQKSRFNAGEILFGKLRPYFHKVGIGPVSGVCSTDILVVVAKEAAWHSYILAIVSRKAFVDYTDAHSAGTKMPRTNWKDMRRYPLALPPTELAQAFHDYVDPLYQRVGLNVRQNRHLAEIRDTLLPGLLSGNLEPAIVLNEKVA